MTPQRAVARGIFLEHLWSLPPPAKNRRWHMANRPNSRQNGHEHQHSQRIAPGFGEDDDNDEGPDHIRSLIDAQFNEVREENARTNQKFTLGPPRVGMPAMPEPDTGGGKKKRGGHHQRPAPPSSGDSDSSTDDD